MQHCTQWRKFALSILVDTSLIEAEALNRPIDGFSCVNAYEDCEFTLGDIGFYECTVLRKLTTTLASVTAMSYFGCQRPQTAVTVKCEKEVPEEEDKPSLVTGK